MWCVLPVGSGHRRQTPCSNSHPHLPIGDRRIITLPVGRVRGRGAVRARLSQLLALSTARWLCRGAAHTLHPTPYTLNPAPYTLHPKP